MLKHQYFDLSLHETEVLEAILQSRVLELRILHEWPLSCVEQLVMADGRRWIYKSQFGPTVEAEFYANVRSELLPAAQVLPASEAGHVNMLFAYIEGPQLADLVRSMGTSARSASGSLRPLPGLKARMA